MVRVSGEYCENMGCQVTETHEANRTSDLVNVAQYRASGASGPGPFLVPYSSLCVRLGEEAILHPTGLTNS